LQDGRFEVFWGTDEMLLAAAVLGARGAVGTTYNFAAPIYHQLLRAHHVGNNVLAAQWQGRAVQLIRLMMRFPFLSAGKHLMAMLGCPCGPCRLPVPSLTGEQARRLENDLQALGYFDWLTANPELGEL
jgi:N-acetylneuraminate lyase